MVRQMDEEGFGNCTNTGACEVECPKGISLENIARMNREYLKSNLPQINDLLQDINGTVNDYLFIIIFWLEFDDSYIVGLNWNTFFSAIGAVPTSLMIIRFPIIHPIDYKYSFQN